MSMIGKKVMFMVEGIPESRFCGLVIGNEKGLFVVRGNDGKVVRINKTKVVLFSVDGEEDPLQTTVYGCFNSDIGCNGVKYLKVGPLVELEYENFMGICPKRAAGCQKVCLGDHRSLSSKVLANNFDGLLIGDFPK